MAVGAFALGQTFAAHRFMPEERAVRFERFGAESAVTTMTSHMILKMKIIPKHAVAHFAKQNDVRRQGGSATHMTSQMSDQVVFVEEFLLALVARAGCSFLGRSRVSV